MRRKKSYKIDDLKNKSIQNDKLAKIIQKEGKVGVNDQ